MLMLPGDASEQEIEELRENLGFNDSLSEQYLRFAYRAVQGDLGESLYSHTPVMELVLERLPASLELAIAAMFLALIIAVPIGIISAIWRGTWIDMGSMLGALFGLSMPHFWLGIMLMLFFSVYLGWLPTSGRGTLAQLCMPAI